MDAAALIMSVFLGILLFTACSGLGEFLKTPHGLVATLGVLLGAIAGWLI